jgi:hypothetical protein
MKLGVINCVAIGYIKKCFIFVVLFLRYISFNLHLDSFPCALIPTPSCAANLPFHGGCPQRELTVEKLAIYKALLP